MPTEFFPFYRHSRHKFHRTLLDMSTRRDVRAVGHAVDCNRRIIAGAGSEQDRVMEEKECKKNTHGTLVPTKYVE